MDEFEWVTLALLSRWQGAMDTVKKQNRNPLCMVWCPLCLSLFLLYLFLNALHPAFPIWPCRDGLHFQVVKFILSQHGGNCELCGAAFWTDYYFVHRKVVKQ